MEQEYALHIMRRIDKLEKSMEKFQTGIMNLLNRLIQEDDEIYTTQMICERFHVDRKTVYHACKSGALAYKQNAEGGKKWYLKVDVKAWLASCPHLLK